MTVTRAHGLYAVRFNTTLLGGITQQNVTTGTETRSEPTSGEAYARHLSLIRQKPKATFTTNHLASALTLSGVLGVDISTLGAGLQFYAQKHADGGTRSSGSTHRKWTIVKGLVVPQRLSVAHGEDATISYEATAAYDGNNNPIVEADSQALPGGLTDAERFTIGAVAVGGVVLGELKNIDIEFGITVRAEAADSAIWDTHVSITDVKPTITLKGIDVEWLKSTNVPFTGLAATHANTVIYLRKRAVGGTFVADNVAEHVAITTCGLAYITDAFDASGNELAQATLKLDTRYDGTNAPIAVDVASVIA